MIKRVIFLCLAFWVALSLGGLAWGEQNDITISEGKEFLPVSGEPQSLFTTSSVGTLQGACGSTTPGSTNWVYYYETPTRKHGLVLRVDTSAAGFTTTPLYFCSLGGTASHWAARAQNAIYHPSPTWFQVVLNFEDNARITPAFANANGWHLNWLGIVCGGGSSDPGGRGDISFVLTWTHSGSSRSEGPDIDMWVTDPNNYTLSTSRNGYSLGPTPNGGRIDHDDLGGWGSGDGGGPERAYWPTGSASRGTYRFGVRYYQGTGTAAYTFRVYVGTTAVRTYTGSLTRSGSAITVGSYSY